MDLSELIKSYTQEQKNVFTAFCINWPLAFTVMYVYSSSFQNYVFHLQLIFSASATIIAELFTFFTMIMVAIFINELGSRKFQIRKFMWLPCLVCPGSCLAMAMLYRAGKDSSLAEILISESLFTFVCVFVGMVSFPVLDFVKNTVRKKECENNNVENGECNSSISHDGIVVSLEGDHYYKDYNIKYIYKGN